MKFFAGAIFLTNEISSFQRGVAAPAGNKKGKRSSKHPRGPTQEMAVPVGFVGTIEDDEEVENDDIDSEEEDVRHLSL